MVGAHSRIDALEPYRVERHLGVAKSADSVFYVKDHTEEVEDDPEEADDRPEEVESDERTSKHSSPRRER